MNSNNQQTQIAVSGLSSDDIAELQVDLGSDVNVGPYVQKALDVKQTIDVVVSIGEWMLVNLAWESISTLTKKIFLHLSSKNKDVNSCWIRGSIQLDNSKSVGFNIIIKGKDNPTLVIDRTKSKLLEKRSELRDGGIFSASTEVDSDEIKIQIQ